MANSSFNKADLNLLRSFMVLYQTQNTSRAAEVLNLSQSAVSRILQRLRGDFNDQLFIGTRNGLLPTARADSLAIELPILLEQLEKIYLNQQEFNPANLKGSIKISGVATALTALSSQLPGILGKQAPNLQFELDNWSSSTREQLLKGEVNIGIHLDMIDMPKQLLQREIGIDSFTLLTRKDHPLSGKKVSKEMLSEFPLAIYSIPDLNMTHSVVERLLQQDKIEMDVLYRTTQLDAMINLVSNSDVIFPGSKLCYHCFPEQLQPLNFEVANMPKLKLTIFYHARHQQNPLYKWLTSEITAILKPLLSNVQ
ncbi:LysR family transcriptional regulator [Thalassotalea psychrophila]|uniref:LysR family transcriptional regulator n=1 Tax=Thalassotalea psychrophila TaxID=3065647 RepID=A0ABY9U3V7_9GAMM|nr:LysR family transcriptional regulator [Colwelliaceae bacterium SQ149]